MQVFGSLGFGLFGFRQFGQNTTTLKLAKVGQRAGQSRFGQSRSVIPKMFWNEFLVLPEGLGKLQCAS